MAQPPTDNRLVRRDVPWQRHPTDHILSICPILSHPRLRGAVASSSKRLDAITTALKGHYDIKEELGRGGMAGVYAAIRLADGDRVAVKVLRPEFAVSVGAERFHREIRFLQQLDHANILPLLTSEQIGNFLLYVMPFAAGGSLSTRLKEQVTFPLDEVLAITRSIAAALDYAHEQNVIHRDIKPGNILFHDGRAVLCDFGVARAIVEAGGEHLSSSGLIIGTPSYMSPEQASGKSELGPTSDIYSLACVVYEMLVGEPPFTGRSAQAVMARHVSEQPPKLRVVRPELPQHAEDAVLKGLSKKPADRPESAGVLVAGLAGN
jgi:serine/threonine protein kinase